MIGHLIREAAAVGKWHGLSYTDSGFEHIGDLIGALQKQVANLQAHVTDLYEKLALSEANQCITARKKAPKRRVKAPARKRAAKRSKKVSRRK